MLALCNLCTNVRSAWGTGLAEFRLGHGADGAPSWLQSAYHHCLMAAGAVRAFDEFVRVSAMSELHADTSDDGGGPHRRCSTTIVLSSAAADPLSGAVRVGEGSITDVLLR